MNAPLRKPVLLESRRFAVSEIPVTLKCRIRAHLAQLDDLKRQTTEAEAALGADARRFADELGLTVKPSVPQLRRMVGGEV